MFALLQDFEHADGDLGRTKISDGCGRYDGFANRGHFRLLKQEIEQADRAKISRPALFCTGRLIDRNQTEA
jgi:hypothetical protein